MRTFMLAACVWMLPGALFAQSGDLDRFDRSVQRLVGRLAPSVATVRIIAVSDPVGDTTGVAQSVRRVLYRASGVISDKHGEVITVVAGGYPEDELRQGEQLGIEVELHDGQLSAARWLCADPETGVTLLALEPPKEKLRPVRFARKLPGKGAIVVSIGADGFELGHVAHPSRGIRHRGASFPRGIVTTIPAQPGDVGGLLANPSGELVGLLAFSLVIAIEDDEEAEIDTSEKKGASKKKGTSKKKGNSGSRPDRGRSSDRDSDGAVGGGNALLDATRPDWVEKMGHSARVTTPREGGPLGRAVAIPCDLLQVICRSLRGEGQMVRGALGATFQFHHPALVGPTHYGAGALVRKLVEGGSAELGGLLVGDVVQKVDGHELTRPEDLLWFRERVEYGRLGSVIPMQVARMENRRVVSRNLRVQIGTRPEGSKGDQLEPPPEPDCLPNPGSSIEKGTSIEKGQQTPGPDSARR